MASLFSAPKFPEIPERSDEEVREEQRRQRKLRGTSRQDSILNTPTRSVLSSPQPQLAGGGIV